MTFSSCYYNKYQTLAGIKNLFKIFSTLPYHFPIILIHHLKSLYWEMWNLWKCVEVYMKIEYKTYIVTVHTCISRRKVKYWIFAIRCRKSFHTNYLMHAYKNLHKVLVTLYSTLSATLKRQSLFFKKISNLRTHFRDQSCVVGTI